MTSLNTIQLSRTLTLATLLAILTSSGCKRTEGEYGAESPGNASDWHTTASVALQADDLTTARRAAEKGLKADTSPGQNKNFTDVIAEVNAREAFLNQRVTELTQESNSLLQAGDVKNAKIKIAQALKIEKATNLDIARETLNALKGYELANANRPAHNDSQTQPWPDTISKTQNGILLIGVKFSDGLAQGTGFAVGEDLIVTNNHVISHEETDNLAEQIVVVNSDKQNIRIKGLLYRDSEKDIAVIRTQDKWPRAAQLKLLDGHPLFESPLKPGEEVAALGHPKGFTFSTAIGHVSAIRPAKTMPFNRDRANTNGVWIQHSASISQGNSGGPLINRAGDVVAMNTLIFYQGESQNLNFAISAADIRDAVNQAKASDLIQFAGTREQQSALRNAIEQL